MVKEKENVTENIKSKLVGVGGTVKENAQDAKEVTGEKLEKAKEEVGKAKDDLGQKLQGSKTEGCQKTEISEMRTDEKGHLHTNHMEEVTGNDGKPHVHQTIHTPADSVDEPNDPHEAHDEKRHGIGEKVKGAFHDAKDKVKEKLTSGHDGQGGH